MVRKLQQPSSIQPTDNAGQVGATERHPPESRAVLNQVEKLLQHPQMAALVEIHPRPEVVKAVRDCLDKN